MLGVLAAGRAYVALDADFPAERNGLISSEAGACAVISIGEIAVEARAYFPREVPIVDIHDLSRAPPATLRSLPRADDLAAIYYTSGSSGEPKGIAWSHRSLLHWVRSFTDTAQICCSDRMPLLFSASVSASFRSIYCSLLNGASLHILPPLDLGLAALSQQIRARGITIFHSVPTLMRRIAESVDVGDRLDTVRVVCIGGDRVQWSDVDTCRRIFSRDVLVYSVLTSTEAGPFIHAFVDDQLRATMAHPPAGRPAPGWTVMIVGEDGEPVADGQSGDIVVTSRFTGLGYWRGTDLRVDSFPIDPEDPELRIYKTGDLALRRPNGLIEFIGRKDRQIKLRGHRVELGEVESGLKSCRGVSDAAVVVRRDESGGPRLLVAYCELEPTVTRLSPRHLRAMLAESLPLFMVPSSIKILDALPRLSNFKIDREELRRRDELWCQRTRVATARLRIGPSNAVQETLLELWRDVLDRGDIGPDDDFFLCGGDSLAAVDLLHRIEEKLRYRLPLTILTEAPTVSQLEARLKTARLGRVDNMIRIHTTGRRPPLFTVHSLYSHSVGLLPVLRSLGPEQPVYGLHPPGMDWTSAGCTTLRHVAAHYIDEIKAVQPHGPYRLLGTSFGGLVVFEMALQLQGSGETVEYLAMVDTYPPTCRSEHGTDLWQERTLRRPQKGRPIEALLLRVAETHVRMTCDYVLDSRVVQNVFQGDLTYFCCMGNPIVAGHDRRRLWQRFARRLRLLQLPSPHNVALHGVQQTPLRDLLRASLEGNTPDGSNPAAVYDRNYRLADSSRRQSIFGSSGDVYDIEPDRMQGHVEEVRIDDETIQLSGWAIEPCRRQPAQTIAVFLGDRFLGYGASCESRPDIAKHLAATSAQYAGFNFDFQRSIAAGVAGRPRLFVLSHDGCAAELPVPC